MRKIPLYKRGFKHPIAFTLVDDEDYNFLINYSWWIRYNSNKTIKYAATTISFGEDKGKNMQLHCMLIPNSNPNLQIDHKDGDGLNNQRGNLQLITPSQNQAKKKTQLNNTSGYRGVSFDKKSNKWVAQIVCKGVKQYLGAFHTKEKAAKVYNKAAFEAFGEFAKLYEIVEAQEIVKGEIIV